MENIKLKIANKEIPLRFRMNQFIEMEEKLGNVGNIWELIDKDQHRLVNLVFVILVMGRAGLKAAGEDPSWLTEDWLRENMDPHDLLGYQVGVLACMGKERESEAAKEENENKERDLVLEEINAKKDPVNSHTGE